jgi:hypothetical protein
MEVVASSDFSPGMSADQCEAVRAVMEVDTSQGVMRFVWKARTAAMFTRNRRPEYMAAGWNRAYAGKSVGVTPIQGASWIGGKVEPLWGRCDFRHMGVRYQLHMHDVSRLLTGKGLRTPIERKKRVSRWRDDMLQDVGLVRTMIGVTDGEMRWLPVSRAAWDRLAAARIAHGADAGERSYAMYQGQKVGKPVTANAQGYVSFGGGMTMAWAEVCRALGVRMSQPAPRAQERVADAPAFLVRMLLEAAPDVSGTAYRWKARGALEWQTMVMCGALKKMPTPARMDMWHDMRAGRFVGEKTTSDGAVWPGDIHDRAFVRIGEFRVTGRELRAALGE